MHCFVNSLVSKATTLFVFLTSDICSSNRHRFQTAIFDCCHSGAAASYADSLRDRFLAQPCLSNILEIDMELLVRVSTIQNIPAGLQNDAALSHIVLAACQQGQCAYELRPSAEHPASGLFTASLVRRLRQLAMDGITYAELVDLLPIFPSQTPQCKGAHTMRNLFNGAYDAGSLRRFELKLRQDGRYEISAGRLHRLAIGMQVPATAVSAESVVEEGLGALAVEEVGDDWSILARPLGLPALTLPAAVLVPHSVHDLKVYVDPTEFLRLAIAFLPPAVPPEAVRSKPYESNQSFVRVDTLSNADIAVKQDSNGDFIVERLDALTLAHTERTVRIPGRGDADRLPSILDTISHFKRHLERHNSSSGIDEVTLELYRLTESDVGLNMPDASGDLFVDSRAILSTAEGAGYGCAILNHSDYDLYPYLFYFDPSDYSIRVSPDFIRALALSSLKF